MIIGIVQRCSGCRLIIHNYGCGDRLVIVKAVCQWVWSQLYPLPQHLHHPQLVLSVFFPLPFLQFHLLLPPLFLSFLESLFCFKLGLHEHVHTLLHSFLHFTPFLFCISLLVGQLKLCMHMSASVRACVCVQVCMRVCMCV